MSWPTLAVVLLVSLVWSPPALALGQATALDGARVVETAPALASPVSAEFPRADIFTYDEPVEVEQAPAEELEGGVALVDGPAGVPHRRCSPIGHRYDSSGSPVAPSGVLDDALPNTNPFDGPVDQDVFVVDSYGTVLDLVPGESLTGSPDGMWVQVRGPDGSPTGVRLDGPHKPASHPDVRAQVPHAHVPGVTNADGTPWLPRRWN